MTAKRFLRTAFLSAALAVGGFTAITVLVDPYDYWGRPRIKGLNEYKPLAHTHLDAVKHRQYLRTQPRIVLAGNSRVDVGFDPKGPQWAAAGGPVYNYGLPGVSLAAVIELLMTSMADHRPERVYLGIDFLDFIIPEDRWSGFKADPLVPDKPTLGRSARRLSETTFSLDALVHAGMTVMEQGKDYPADTRSDGFTPLKNYQALVQREGHAALFEQRSRDLVRRLLQEPRKMDWDGPGGNAQWQRLEQFLQLARAQGVEVVLFTYPYHSELLETLRQTGKWPEMREWRERLTELAARESVTLWSFTGYDAYSTETVPQPGDTRTHMRWFWEAGHFKPELGALMVARMLELPGAPKDLGRKLTPQDLEILTATLEAEGEVYRERPDASSSRIASYVSTFNKADLTQVAASSPVKPTDKEM